MDPEEELRKELILERCKGLRGVMAELKGEVPNRTMYNNRIVEIESLVRTDVEAADQSLLVLCRKLKDAPDGAGGFILNGERSKRLFGKDEL